MVNDITFHQDLLTHDEIKFCLLIGSYLGVLIAVVKLFQSVC